MQIDKTPLEGENVRLEPLDRRHIEALGSAITDGELWKIPVTFVPHPNDLGQFVADAESAFRAGRELAFATVDKQSNRVVGSTRFMNIEATHRRLEIGFTFLAASRQRTHVNTEAKLLMLRHAFEHWRCNRVELITDVLNSKSRSAIARIGAQQEAILRQHMVMRDGRVRDSVLFAIIRPDWPATKAALQKKLER
jgi:RimJ/RimL family protein N-acetyltransferase